MNFFENSLTFDEKKLADLLRQEIMKDSVSSVEKQIVPDFSNMELISTCKPVEEEKPYVSPIFTMSEDEILAFVEEFDVGELATLSVAELNHIGEVLGVEPKILLGLED